MKQNPGKSCIFTQGKGLKLLANHTLIGTILALSNIFVSYVIISPVLRQIHHTNLSESIEATY